MGKMSFRDDFTTDSLLLEESSIIELQDPKAPIIDVNSKDYKSEKDKMVISNDAYSNGLMLEALSKQLECLNNRLVK